MERRLVLCRHTQTDHNKEGRYTGQMDVSVNETGQRQAQLLAPQVAALPGVCGILSSDLQRTKYLATLIGQQTGYSPIFLRGLREVALGSLEGLTKAKVVASHPDLTFRTSNPRFDFQRVGGETAGMVIQRQIQALRHANNLFAGATGSIARVVVVGHGSALRLLFGYHLQLFGQLHEQGHYQEVDWPF